MLVGKILEGWKQDGGAGPALKLAAMYVDQFPRKDVARAMAAKYKVPIFGSIAQSLTLGGDRIAVDGVISIGEHGDYPWNDLGQHLYPRRRFFTEIADAIEKSKTPVPVFNDKHLGPQWSDAKWMYDRAKELKIPLMSHPLVKSIWVPSGLHSANHQRKSPVLSSVRAGGNWPLLAATKLCTASASCLRLFWSRVRFAAARAFCTAGSKSPIRIAMMAITTINSMSVKAARRTSGSS